MIHNKLCSFFVVWKFPCTIILTTQHWVTLNFSKTTKVLKKCLESIISIKWLLENYILISFFFLVNQYIINKLFYQRWSIGLRYLSQELLQVKILGNYLNKLFCSVEFQAYYFGLWSMILTFRDFQGLSLMTGFIYKIFSVLQVMNELNSLLNIYFRPDYNE